MKQTSKNGTIYIYIIFIVTILLTVMAFTSKYVIGNLEIYDSIKDYFMVYGKDLGETEEMIINYFDDPKSISYLNTKLNSSKSVTRYKNYIEYTMENGEYYDLSLTSLDEEYKYNLNSLKFLDLFWGTSENNCDLTLSILRWEKDSLSTILNNKKNLNYLENRVLLYAVGNDDEVNLYFSTGAYFNSGNLLGANFSLNNDTISFISGSLDRYDLTLDSSIDFSLINTININDGEIKDVNGNLFEADEVLVKKDSNIYTNRFRITDSFGSIDKNNYDYKIIINSNNICSFYVEGFDGNNNIVKLPDKKIYSKSVDLFNTSKKKTISKKVKIGDIDLSNYLYKF